jgi:hypothetical protein
LPRSREDAFAYGELRHFHAAAVEQLLGAVRGRAGALEPPPQVLALLAVAIQLDP